MNLIKAFLLLTSISYSQDFDIEWSKLINSALPYNDGWEIVNLPDSSHVFVGTINGDTHLLKLGPNDSTVWEKTYGREYYSSISATSDHLGNIYLVGRSVQENSILINKYNADGDSLSSFTQLTDSLNSYIHKVIFTSDTCLLVTGSIKHGVDHKSDIMLLKMDLEGSRRWLKHYYLSEPEYYYKAGHGTCTDVIEDNGDYVLTGYVFNDLYDIFIMKVDNQGDSIWSNVYLYDGYNTGRSIVKIPNGYLINAYTNGKPAGFNDYITWGVTIISDSTGNLIAKRDLKYNYIYSVFTEHQDSSVLVFCDTSEFRKSVIKYYKSDYFDSTKAADIEIGILPQDKVQLRTIIKSGRNEYLAIGTKWINDREPQQRNILILKLVQSEPANINMMYLGSFMNQVKIVNPMQVSELNQIEIDYDLFNHAGQVVIAKRNGTILKRNESKLPLGIYILKSKSTSHNLTTKIFVTR